MLISVKQVREFFSKQYYIICNIFFLTCRITKNGPLYYCVQFACIFHQENFNHRRLLNCSLEMRDRMHVRNYRFFQILMFFKFFITLRCCALCLQVEKKVFFITFSSIQTLVSGLPLVYNSLASFYTSATSKKG